MFGSSVWPVWVFSVGGLASGISSKTSAVITAGLIFELLNVIMYGELTLVNQLPYSIVKLTSAIKADGEQVLVVSPKRPLCIL